MRSLWIFNRIIASILALMAIYGMYNGITGYIALHA
jgi:hypothetical protein